MKNKKNLTILSVALSSAIVSIPIYTSIASHANINSLELKSSSLNSSKAPTFTNYYTENKFETLSNASGPIVLKNNGKTILNNDWYGNQNWSLDVDKIDSKSTKIVDWDYMPTHDWIFVITDKSYVIKINTYDGEILARADISSVLSGANKIAKVDFNESLYVWNSTKQDSELIKLDRNTLNRDTNGIATNAKVTGFLGAIIPLDVGYSLGVYNNSKIEDNTNITSLTLKFIDDSGKEISPQPSSMPSVTFSTKQFKDISIYGFKRKNNANSTLLIIGNDFYEVKLNKSSMNQTTIAKIEFKIGNNNETLTNLNSAFMDDNEIVYFKDKGGKKIYQIDFNNTFSNFIDLDQTSDTTLKTIIKNTENMLQIFPVITKDGNSVTTTRSNIFLADTDNNYVTGIVGKSLYGNNGLSSLKPEIKLANSNFENILKTNVPSIVDQTFFASDNNADILKPENVFLKSDDIKGELYVKAIVTRNSWFDSSKKTYSIISKEYKAESQGSVKPKKISEQVEWATDNTFYSWFGKYTPEQLVESDLEKKENLITIQGVTNADVYFKGLSKKVAIKSRNKSTGEMTLSGVVSYSDKYGNYVNSPLLEKTYKIKASTDGSYSLKFYGNNNKTANGIKQETGTETATNVDISMDNVKSGTEAFEFKKYLPSLIDPNDLDKFIEEENNYIPSRRTISKVANDTDGTMTLTVTYTGFPANVPYKFIQKFTGFLTTAQAAIDFKGDAENRKEIQDKFPNENLKSIISIAEYNNFKENVSTEINPAQLGGIYTTKLDGMGYKPKVKIEPLEDKDTEFGSIKVTLDYSEKVGDNKKLKEPYKNEFGLKEYKITQRYTGLLPIGVRFKMDIDPQKAKVVVDKYNVDSRIPTDELKSVLELKEYTPDEISIFGFAWDGEKLKFKAIAQSKKYKSVQQNKDFILDWSPKFKSIRDRNMAIAVSVAIVGTALISAGIALYILRRNRIRRLLK